jgi:ABC transporter, ATP-binding protein
MLVGNIYLGLSIMIPVVLSYSLILVSKRIQLKKQYENFEQLRHNSESFQEAIELQQDIKSFGLGNKIREKLNKDMDKSEQLKLKVEMVLFIPLFLSWVVAQGTLVVVIIVGTTLYASGSINLLYLIGYIFVAMKMKDIVDGLAANTSELFYLDARIKRIKELKETQVQKGKEIKLDNFGIELKNVKFGYDKDSPVLKDVSFTANQNEVTALVGVSGCGKTSILKLISRLYDYDDGQIIIDGHDIKEISTDTLYKYVSIVFQDVVLFNTSIMENIRIGRSSATDEEVMAAAKMACCDFIDDLENGYNTIVGENGATLSGGERQRLSIARAFLKDSPIVILDEISAALDVENEKKIQDSLNNLIKNKTVIVISHRLKSIENVDKIIVLDNGIVECQGTHSYLLEHSKVYGKLIERSKAVESFKY